MNAQQRRERKNKRREKIRREHLEQSSRDQEGLALKRFFAGRSVIHTGAPDRNDREGWARFNALDLKCVVKQAIQMYGKDRVLWRFIENPGATNKYDVDTVAEMLTKAAQKICCSPPFFIPLFILTKNASGIQMRQPKFAMEKESTPFGLAWYNDDWDGAYHLVYVGGKPRLFAFTTHAIDRLMERVFKPMLTPPTKLAYAMNSLRPEPVTRSSEGFVIPLTIGDDKARYLLGYCPYDEHKHMVVARTFLLPTMKGTPERDKLNAAGMEDFQISTMPQLMDARVHLESKGIKLQHTVKVTKPERKIIDEEPKVLPEETMQRLAEGP